MTDSKVKTPFMRLPSSSPVDLGSGERYPLFNRISLETASMCNRSCSFCPVSTGRRDFVQQHMADELWKSIVRQITGFDGVVQLFLIDEPTLNPTYLEKIADLRWQSPRCTIYCSTNGDAIVGSKDPRRKLEGLWEAGLSSINLNIYDGGAAGEGRILAYQDVIRSCADFVNAKPAQGKYSRGHSPRKLRVYVTDMRPDRLTAGKTDLFHDRKAEDRANNDVPVDNRCPRPHRHMVVRYDGKVLLCCALDPTDPRADEDGMVVGDLNRQTVSEVWNSDAMNMHRWLIQENGRRHDPCDSCGLRTSFPGIFKPVAPTEEQEDRWRKLWR